MLNVRDMTPEQKEEFHQAAEARMQPFHYEHPEANDKPKQILSICKSDLVRVQIQVVKSGGENNLHYHVNSDTCWMVLKGRARFYGVDDKLLGDFGPHEGILIPGGSRYWFEKTGDEDLELLQMVGNDVSKGKSQRINLDAHKDWMTEAALQVYETADK